MAQSQFKVAPSILSADFANLAQDCRELAADADWFHVDIMDGHFVPNLTIGPCVAKAFRKAFKDAFIDCHLMVSDPRKWLNALVDSKVDQITFHIEAVSGIEEAKALCQEIRTANIRPSVSLRPKTSVQEILPLVEQGLVDNVLVMTVEPGFGGQTFMEDQMSKIRTIRASSDSIDICVDGGINELTAAHVSAAGANIAVAGSAVFNAPDRVGMIRTIRKVLEQNYLKG